MVMDEGGIGSVIMCSHESKRNREGKQEIQLRRGKSKTERGK